MIQLNTIHLGDCMESLKKLEDNSISLIITSPPYNKKGVINYDSYSDNLEEEKYQKWQIEFLNECFRVLKPDGSLFYNHKIRQTKNYNSCIHPLSWILKSKFIFRQEIIWDRLGDRNTDINRFIPTTEQIFWLTKTTNVRFKRISGLTEVWDIKPDYKSKHPAPFPVEIPDIILDNVLGDKEMRKNIPDDFIVLDPFMGSGTVAVSAIKHNVKWLGFDLSENYQKMAYDRIEIEFGLKVA